jgi:hypothetical protein
MIWPLRKMYSFDVMTRGQAVAKRDQRRSVGERVAEGIALRSIDPIRHTSVLNGPDSVAGRPGVQETKSI